MQPATALAAYAAPPLHPSDPPGPSVAGDHPGRVGTRDVAGPLDAFEPHDEVGPPDGAALLDAAALLGVVGPLDGSGLHDAGEPLGAAVPPGGVGPLVGFGHPDASEGPAERAGLAVAARHATELLRVVASLVSELPAFGLWLHHSEGLAGCQTWG